MTDQELNDINQRLTDIERNIGYIPNGLRFTLLSPESVDPGHLHTGLKVGGGVSGTVLTSNGVGQTATFQSIPTSSMTITSEADNATPTPIVSSLDAITDWYILTALTQAAAFGTPTGTPGQGHSLMIRIKDNGTAKALSWGAAYRFSSDLPAPTTTTLGKTMYLGFKYNSVSTTWDCLAILDYFT